MDRQERMKREAVVIKLLSGYPSSNTSVTEHTIRAYVDATADSRLEAIQRAATMFAKGQVEDHNNAFPPSAAQLAEKASAFEAALLRNEQRAVELHSGILEVDFGRGTIDMRGLTREEQDRILANKGLDSDGKSLAYKPITEIRAALAGDLARPAIPAPKMKRISA